MSSHPLDDFEEFFNKKRVIKINKLVDKKENDVVVLGGTITKIRRITTKKNDNMAFVTLTDKTGSIDLVIFPKTFEKVKDELVPDIPVLFAGRVNLRDNAVSIIIEMAKALDPAKYAKKFEGVTFKVRDINTEEEILQLKEIIRDSPGTTPVRILRYLNGDEKSMILNNMVSLTPDIEEMLKKFI
jgi:DNA polymerase-3 subunit alpha